MNFIKYPVPGDLKESFHFAGVVAENPGIKKLNCTMGYAL
jgi:hypothetical protein